MAFGTDVVMDMPGKTRADMMFDYLAVWETAGVPAPAILKAMTTDTAALFRMKAERGAIAKGLAADIIATPENPLQNIQALRKVAFVMKAGTVIKQRRCADPVFRPSHLKRLDDRHQILLARTRHSRPACSAPRGCRSGRRLVPPPTSSPGRGG